MQEINKKWIKLSLLFCVRLWFPKLDHLPYLYTPRIVIPTEQKHSKTFNLLLQIFHSIRPFYFHPQICMFVHFTDVSGSFLEMWRSNTFSSNLKCIRNCDDRELLNFAITAVNSFNILTAVGTKLNSSLSSLFWIHFDHSSWNKSTLIDSSCRSSNAKRRQLKLMTT